jgi:hypothetical protein
MPIVAKLDELGRPAWIALMIFGFVVFWPLGLAVLVFLFGSGRMACWHHDPARWQYKMEKLQRKMDLANTWMSRGGGWGGGPWGGNPWRNAPSSGNRAFDEYRTETLRRLEEEQKEFHEFLGRLRMAKDKAEFDEFMSERRNRPNPPTNPESPPQN